MAKVWSQWEDGFDLMVVKTGATATVDATNHNRLTATIAAAADDSDMAEGRILRTDKLGTGAEGYFRWKFTTPASFTLASNSSILVILAGTNAIADFYMDSSRNVNLFTDAGVLAAGAQNPSASFTLASSTTYTCELWWKQNQALKLAINGSVKVNTTGLSGSSVSGVTTEVRLGIDHYDGVAASGWTAVIDQAQLGGAFTDSFADPAVPVNTVAPVVSGSLEVGGELDVTDGTFTSGLPILGHTYAWQKDSVAIVGATGNSRINVTPDIPGHITATVAASNSWGASTPALSNSVGPIAAGNPPPPPPPPPPPAPSVGTLTLTVTFPGTLILTPKA